MKNFGHEAENKIGNTAGKTAVIALKKYQRDEIENPCRKVLFLSP